MNNYSKTKTRTLLLSIAISGLLSSILTIYFLNKSEIMFIQRNKEAVVRLIDEVWSKGNLQIVDELVSPQYSIKHDPGDQWEGKTIDLETYKERVRKFRHIFPDLKFYIEDLICEGNKVVVSWRFTGTQKGDLPGLPGTNKTVDVSGLTIYYFSNGKMIGHWQIFDKWGLIEQLSTNGDL